MFPLFEIKKQSGRKLLCCLFLVFCWNRSLLLTMTFALSFLIRSDTFTWGRCSVQTWDLIQQKVVIETLLFCNLGRWRKWKWGQYAVLALKLCKTNCADLPEYWGGDRDSECDRISAGLSQVMKLYIAEPFVLPVDLNLHPSYASIVEYPMDLFTIKSRLDNRFYRRASAVEFDVNYNFTNACKFNEPKSDIVRFALKITDLCLEIIRNRYAVDVATIYSQLSCKLHDGGIDCGLGTSGARAARISNIRSRSCQKSNSESGEDSSNRKSEMDTSESKLNCFKNLGLNGNCIIK